MSNPSDDLAPLRQFVGAMTHLVERTTDESTLVTEGTRLLGELIVNDTWLPDAYARPHAEHYQQYLLHCDPLERFSVVSFVWGPGQKTPIHDHTVWGLIGMLRGAEYSQSYAFKDATNRLIPTKLERLEKCSIAAVSPDIGDIHEVSNALDSAPSISIHVYGANIGAVRRHVFDAETGQAKDFVSGYASPHIPNLWDRS
jgi:predicted metal-dependent enzyme (double-stranded beta helix superfamily)